MKPKTFHKNDLPYIQPAGTTFFITIRMEDALPPDIIDRLISEFNNKKAAIQQAHPNNPEERIYEEKKRFFGKYDQLLDQHTYGNCYLKHPDASRIVAVKLEEMDGRYFDLHAYCIMPNHVHFLIDTALQFDPPEIVDEYNYNEVYLHLDETIQLFKGNTTYYSNQAIGRRGRLWERKDHKHCVRNYKEWKNIVNYIMLNPINAGLTSDMRYWKYAYCKWT